RGVKPFQFGDAVLDPLVDHRYNRGQEIVFFYQVFFPEKSQVFSPNDLTLEYELIQQGQSIAKYEVPFAEKLKQDQVPEGSISILDHCIIPQVNNGPARLVARLKNGQHVIAEAEPAVFSVDPVKPPMPWRLSSGIPAFDSQIHKLVLAQQYLRLNQIDKAEVLLQDVSTDSHSNLDARIQLMNLELKAKQYDKVLSQAHDLEIQYPNNKDLLWLLGWAYYGLNQYDDALRFFERDRIQEPNSIQILNTLADVYARLAQYNKSIEMIQKSLSLDPNQPEIIEMKEKVQKQTPGSNPG